MTNLTDLSEREYFALLSRRTGLYVGRPSFSSVAAFLVGYDQAARRHGGPGLDGWREWLMANHQAAGNLVWQAQVRQIALPDEEAGRDLTPDQEAHLLQVLFELLDGFLAERDGAASGS
ncbi:hypothetical protein ACIRBX_00250 [Kitasatospora sp. NPDC096147]|uniref:hypothetical protein n=1 Tax=Kitasatospora sp. NPDC096147 TaxID=3364093 RepID=UPI0038300BB0